MSTSSDTKPIPERNPAVTRPRQVYVKKPLAVLQQYEPLEHLPAYLWPQRAPNNRWPPVFYHGFPVPTSRIISHWYDEILPQLDRNTLCEEDLKSLDEPPVSDNYFLAVILDLEDKLSHAVGWKIRVLPVHGIPGDRYSRVARLRDNYYPHRPPDDVIQKLQEILGTQDPPMWYLTEGDHAQWDSFPGHNPNPRPPVSKEKKSRIEVPL
ncbi:hypothetical protein C0993_012232 [Termitomyces sp. T159_Od127]|nr:hypothetical protein C0993_012232 [Termitomyces sp. T159_Od127]